jgi:S-adenosylmethionine decarboxylase
LEQEQYNVEGDHCIADLWQCDKEILNDKKKIKKILKEAALASGATPLKYQDFKFNPNGITGVWILSESHISIHTYPEHEYAHVDIFTCGGRCRPEDGVKQIVEKLKSKKNKIINLARGKQSE